MQSPISIVYTLVYETLAPAALLQEFDSRGSDFIPWKDYREAFRILHPAMINHLMTVQGQDSLTVAVRMYQAGTGAFLNQIEHYKVVADRLCTKKQTAQALQILYRDIQESLACVLLYLETYFFHYLDLQQPAPLFVWAQKKAGWLKNLSSCKKAWLNRDEDPELTGLVFSILEKQLSEAWLPSYQQTYYLQTFLADLEPAEQPTPIHPFSSFPALLARHNFNHPRVTNHCLHTLLQQLPEDASVPEQAGHIALLLKSCRQLHCHDVKWLPGYPSFTDAVCKPLEQELLYCYRKTKTEHLAATPQPTNAAAQVPFVTTLSVGQLAVMMRLLVDCGIIQCPNHSDLLKRVANHVATTKTTKISADSLRVKYYAPDKTAITIAQEHLHAMLGVLRKL